MDPARIRSLLQKVSTGELDVAGAFEELRRLPFADLGFARIDHHRALRQGMPEVVLGDGKTAEQIVAIIGELMRSGQNVLVTRVDAAKAEKVRASVPEVAYRDAARVLVHEHEPIMLDDGPPIAVVTAGTSDVPVAEEALETLRMLRLPAERVYDVGVAGIHRLFDALAALDGAPVVIVVAGMEGALPSVVGGLIRAPVIGVPTSVGYGAALGGLTALMGMLTSCASGVTVVNIDNGFGAAMAAGRIRAAQRAPR